MLRFKQFLVEGISRNLPMSMKSRKMWEDLARRYSRGDLDTDWNTNPFLYYTGSGSAIYNEFLRDPVGYANRPNFSIIPDNALKTVDNLTSHFDRHAVTLDKPITVYRGITVNPDYWTDILKKSREGNYFTDPAFMSTTLNKNMIPRHLKDAITIVNPDNLVPKILQIHVPPNTRFLPNTIEPPFIRGENELIFGRNTPLKIKPTRQSTFFPETGYPENVDIHQATIMPSVGPNPNSPTLLKRMGKMGLKALPVIGTAASFAAMTQRAQAGDYVGAGLEAASEVADYVPGVGTAASMGIQAYLADRDSTSEEKKISQDNTARKNLRLLAQGIQ